MIYLMKQFRTGITEIFPSSSEQRMVARLVALTTIISLSELLIARFFSFLIMPTEGANSSNLTFLSIIFLSIFGVLRVINYGKEYYRLNVFEKALVERDGANNFANSWRWAAAMELTSLLALCGRWLFITALLFWFSWIFGFISFLVGVLIFNIFSIQMRRQYILQKNFIDLRNDKIKVSNALKVKTRVLAGELGSLASAFGLLLLFATLIFLNADAAITPSVAFTLFIAVRMLGQMYSGFSSGLMRYVRARVYYA